MGRSSSGEGCGLVRKAPGDGSGLRDLPLRQEPEYLGWVAATRKGTPYPSLLSPSVSTADSPSLDRKTGFLRQKRYASTLLFGAVDAPFKH